MPGEEEEEEEEGLAVWGERARERKGWKGAAHHREEAASVAERSRETGLGFLFFTVRREALRGSERGGSRYFKAGTVRTGGRNQDR